MRVLHLADLHLGKPLRGLFGKNYTSLRLGQQKIALQRLLESASSLKPDIIIIAGDIMDSSTPSIEAEEVALSFLTEAGKLAPVVLIPGNHDSPRRLRLYRNILSKFNVFIISPDQGETGRKFLENMILELDDLALVGVPFLSPSRLRNIRVFDFIPHESSSEGSGEITWKPEEALRSYSRIMAKLLLKLREMVASLEKRYLIFTLHTYLEGANLSGSEYLVLDWGISPGDIPSADYVALGHIHKPQVIKAAAPTVYSGSPYPLDFSDSLLVKYLAGKLDFQKIPPLNKGGLEGNWDFRGFVTYDLRSGKLLFYPLKSYLLFTLEVRAEDIERALEELSNSLNDLGLNWMYWVRVKVMEGRLSLKEMERISGQRSELLRIELPEERGGKGEFPLGEEEEDIYSKISSPLEMYKLFYEVRRGKEPDEELLMVFKEILDEVLHREGD